MTKDEKSHAERAEEYMQKFSLRPKFQNVINSNDDTHMPLIVTANIAIFGASCAILLSTRDTTLTAAKLLVLIATIFTLITIPLNIWYIVRVKVRLNKLKEAQEKMFDKTKEDIAKTLELFSVVVRSGIQSQANVLTEYVGDREKLIERMGDIGKDGNDYEFLSEKGYFIFESLNELSYYKTLYNFRKIMDSPLEENWATAKLFLDRLSDRLKNFSLILNVVLLICALLISILVA